MLPFTYGEAYDPVLGRTYAEVGAEGRSMHKCQGMSQLLPLPAGGEQQGFGGPRGYKLHDTVLPGGVTREESDPFSRRRHQPEEPGRATRASSRRRR